MFNFQYSESADINRFDALNEYSGNSLKWAEWYYGPQKRILASSQLKISPNKKWLENGVQPSDTVASLLRKAQIIE